MNRTASCSSLTLSDDKGSNVFHTQLHEMLSILKENYPTSKQFNEIFRCGMFEKSNKVAFQQVTYYLFKILDPQDVKKRLPSWPPLDNKLDVQYRKEVLAYANTLNSLYPNANIPIIMSSHLICPEGARFINFIMKLAQLVLKVHLTRTFDDPSLLLELPVCGKLKETSLRVIKTKTAKIKKENERLLKSFYEQMEVIKSEAQLIYKELMEISQEARNEEHKAESENAFDEAKVYNTLEDLNEKCKALQEFEKNVGTIAESIKYLISDESWLEYKSPTDDGSKLNLVEHFEEINNLMSKQLLDANPSVLVDAEKKTGEYERVCAKLEVLCEQAKDLEKKMSEFVLSIESQ